MSRTARRAVGLTNRSRLTPRRAFGVLVALAFSVLAPQSQAQSDSLEQQRVAGSLGALLDAQLTRFEAYGFSGSVLVIRNRRIVLLKGYGLADVGRGVRNSPATRFEINSNIKMLTGAAVLKLVADGRLRLTDSLERYLGAVAPEKRGATIHHLAAHTSGFVVAGTDLPGDSRDGYIRAISQAPRESEPGERYRYTNAGYSLIAAIIEKVSGQTFESYLRQNIFAPAGMRYATFRDEVPPDDTLFARGYVGTPASLEPGPPNPYVWGTRGAGGVFTTLGDMYRWIVAIEDGVVLPPAQRALLFSPPPPPSQEAFGWHVNRATPTARARIDKGGGSPDFATQLLYYPDDSLVIIWASNNLRQRWRQTLNRAIPGVVFGDSVTALPPVKTVKRAQLLNSAGRYRVAGDSLVLRAGTNYLYADTNALGVPTNVMFFAQSSSSFTGYDPATRTITRLQLTPGKSVVVESANGKRFRLVRQK